MSKNIKLIRGQIRQIVKELLPSILTAEQYQTLESRLEGRVLEIEKHVKDTLKEINERHKDTMGYLVRQVSTVTETKKD